MPIHVTQLRPVPPPTKGTGPGFVEFAAGFTPPVGHPICDLEVLAL